MQPKTLLDYIFATFWTDYTEYVEIEENFARISLDDRFLFFHKLLKAKNCLPEVRVLSTKSSPCAAEFKILGDQAFLQERYIEAIKWYTKSVAASIPGSAELASAFANRSAALYRLERYTACLVDVNRALRGRYSEKASLMRRKEACIEHLMLTSNPKISSFLTSIEQLASAVDPMKGSNPSAPSKFEFNTEIMDMNYEMRFTFPPENYPKPTNLPYIRKNMKIKCNPQFGRHIVATGEIKPGEILGMEKAFASALQLNYRFTHCAHCFVKCETLISCTTCSLLLFCSVKCRITAYQRYHRVECKILFNADHFDIKDDIWLAVRILMLVTSQGEGLSAMMHHSVYGRPMEINRNHIPSEFGSTVDYIDVHNLEDNADRATFEECYSLGFTAVLILHLLKYTDFFDDKRDPAKTYPDDLSSQELYVGKLLLKYLFIVKHNAFKIKEILRDDRKPKKFITMDIGSSIYIFHSYFNHSCDPNGTKCFHKDAMVSRAVQLIHSGEQIFLNYGKKFGETPIQERLNYLFDVYKFECTCPACQFNWPVLNGINAATMPKLKRRSITSDSLKGLMCKTRELRRTGTTSFEWKKYNLLCNHMVTYHKNVKKPFKEYYECQEKIEEINATGGNHYSFDCDGSLMYY